MGYKDGQAMLRDLETMRRANGPGRRWLVVCCGAALLILVALGLFSTQVRDSILSAPRRMFRQPEDPPKLDFDPNHFDQVVVTDAYNQPPTICRVEGAIEWYEAVDLDGDGRWSVVVAVGDRLRKELWDKHDIGKLVAFRKGKRIWEFDSASLGWHYPNKWSGRLKFQRFVAASVLPGKAKQIIARAGELEGAYPSVLVVVDQHGSLYASYWHPGTLDEIFVRPLVRNGPPMIVVSGINNQFSPLDPQVGNRLYVRTIFALNPGRMLRNGEAPPRKGLLRVGSEIWYAKILPANTGISGLAPNPLTNGFCEIRFQTEGLVCFLNHMGALSRVGQGDFFPGRPQPAPITVEPWVEKP
jgi:hypothetical protein